LMDEIEKTTDDRKVVPAANNYADYKRSLDEVRYANVVAMAIELKDGRIVTGRSSRRMVAGAALILNAIKTLCGLPDEVALIAPDVLETLQKLKTDILHKDKSTLNLEEILSALSISASMNPTAKIAVSKLPCLAGCQAHCTAILSETDTQIFHDLGIDATCEPEFSSNNLYLG